MTRVVNAVHTPQEHKSSPNDGILPTSTLRGRTGAGAASAVSHAYLHFATYSISHVQGSAAPTILSTELPSRLIRIHVYFVHRRQNRNESAASELRACSAACREVLEMQTEVQNLATAYSMPVSPWQKTLKQSPSLHECGSCRPVLANC